MATEEQLLNEIHFRDMCQELKDSVQKEVSAVLEEKLSKYNKSSFSPKHPNESICPNCSKESQNSQPKVADGVSNPSDSWSPDYSRTQILTQALTRSHSTRSRPTVPTGRVFVSRPSLLTELLQVSHICSVYNIFVAILCLLLVHKITEDVISGSYNLDLDLITWCFGKFDSVITIWLCMFVSSSVVLYAGLQTWANNRHLNKRVFDVSFGVTLAVFMVLLLSVPTHYVLTYDLPIASSFVVLAEQVRFFMKSWAFVRSNLSRGLNLHKVDADYKKTDGDVKELENSKLPDFSKYLYFLFAPTLVYRDEYPRNKSINWSKVAVDFAQVLGCILYTHFLFVRFCVPVFKQFGTQPFSASHLVVSVFSSCFPASLVLLCAFFAFLHAWMNAFAEMLRFSDRMFYKDWWNSTSYARFYRTWNCVVHDWLYEYIYMEFYNPKPKTWLDKHLSTLLVFLISSVVHEYILAFAFRFYYPVLLFMFGGFGVVLMFIKTRAKQFNVFLWVSLILGTGILMCLYSLEWYARRNCPPLYNNIADLVVPRSWFCTSI